MFAEMPSWVPLDMVPLVDQVVDQDLDFEHLDNGPKLDGEKPFELQQKGELKLPSSKLQHTTARPGTCKVVVVKSHMQSEMHKGMTRLCLQQCTTSLLKASAKPARALTQTFQATQNKSTASAPTTSVATRAMPKELSLPRRLPTPLQAAMQLQQKTPTPHKPAAETAKHDLPKQTTRHQERERTENAELLQSRRELKERFIFHIQTRPDEREEGRRRLKWLTEVNAKRKVAKGFAATYREPDLRPVLEPPRLGIFALYYILTKIGLISDGQSHWESKQDIEKNQEELDKLHKLRLEELKKAAESEDKTKRWGLSVQIFSWMGSFTAIITGAAMIMSGVGAVAGALLVVSGIFALTNHILMVSGGWDKICDRLPGDDVAQKRKIITWMQIGISVLCLLLAAGGGLFGGFGAMGEAASNFQAIMGGVMMFAGGISSIGQGVTSYQYRNRLAESLKHKRKIEALKHRQDDLHEKAEAGIERAKQLYKELSKALDFEAELFRADQLALGR